MASVVITPALVLASVLTFRRAIAGAAPITAGSVVYLNSTDSYRAYLATAFSAASAGAVGFALNTSHTVGAPLEFVGEDPNYAVGGVVTAGVVYYLSPTAGQVCVYSDLSAGHYVVPLGVGRAANVLAVKISSPSQTI